MGKEAFHGTRLSGAFTMPARFEVRFESLVDKDRALVFPCDERGRVELDVLSERERINYFFARAMVGRQYAISRVTLRAG